MITLSSEQSENGIKLTIKIPMSDLVTDFTPNQIRMLSMVENNTMLEHLNIIFNMILEVLSRGAKHGKN